MICIYIYNCSFSSLCVWWVKFIFHSECVVFPDLRTCNAEVLQPPTSFMFTTHPECWPPVMMREAGVCRAGYSQKHDVSPGWTSIAHPTVSVRLGPCKVVTGSQTKRHHGDHMRATAEHRDLELSPSHPL